MADVLLVGGGTAGHVLPAIATAQALRRMRPDLTVAFAGLRDGLEERLVGGAGFTFHAVEAVPLPRRVTLDLVGVAPRLLRAVRSSRALLASSGVTCVIAFGGYVALPVALAARRRVPLVLHEQNSRPGVANRIAARFADEVAVTFASSAEHLPTRGPAHVTGNPVQERLRDLDAVGRRAAARERLDLEAGRTTLLVMGGSQGARSINRAVAAASRSWAEMGIQVVHVTGHRGHEETIDWWHEQGVDPDIPGGGLRVIPFLDDMADAYAAADVVLARAGATSIAELTVLGIPAVLVPYPHATAQHQQSNAQALADAGAAVVLPDDGLSGDAVAAAVAGIVTDPATAGRMSRSARSWGRPEAAEALASIVLATRGDHHD